MSASNESPTGTLRPAAHAGRFYPEDPGELRREVNALLAAAGQPKGPVPKALIAPHAGYCYSGPIAASAYAELAPHREVVRRVVLLGPSHFARFRGVAASGMGAFATPLGRVPLDQAAIQRISALPGVHIADGPHAPEHCLEVHLPFLQTVLSDFQLVPLLVGEADEEEVGHVIEALWGGTETRVVVSSDLSHYHDSATARALDEVTARAIETLRGEALDGNDACGFEPIRGLLYVARHRGLRCQRLDLRNSGDTAGSFQRVVGYGAFTVLEPPG